MANSGRKINYQLRPAKNIERKMIRDTALRLFPFSPLNEYQYIGFGAKYFCDFNMIHRSLHINKMISVEKDCYSKEKYEFNKPFACIEMHYGDSNEILPSLEWDKKSIIWLDYDTRFENNILNDIDTVIQNATSGSLFLISFNSAPFKLPDLQKEFETNETIGLFKRKIIGQLGERYFPSDFKEQGMSKWSNYSKLLRKSIFSRIEDTLQDRNSFTLNNKNNKTKKIHVKQILYFDYKDNVEMTTIGYILYSEEDSSKFSYCSFEHLDFYRDNDESFKISVPNFTIKEIKELMQKMPKNDSFSLPKKVFPDNDVEDFMKIYKYFPNFIDTELI